MKLKNIPLLFILQSLIFLTTISAFCQEGNNLSIVKNQKIDSILIKKKSYNKDHPTVGYRIQLYYGNETIAYNYKDKFEKIFPTQTANIEFATPDWKVMVGNYRTRISADSAIVAIKKQFLGAVVVNAALFVE
ncbi:MAG: SPOR domain-containing protein [Flavobacteriaceae bacterium]|nr:SPOR domain-containing protein [Flavobacteriaceae bacterium]